MDVTQIILIVFILLLVIAYPILVSSRNKKENQKMQEQTNSLKRGDKVLTTSGVYGTIVDLQMEADKKIVTIETGSGKNKGYISVDAYAIYNVFRDEPVKAPETPAPETKAEPEKTDKKSRKAKTQEVKETVVTENPTETPVETTPVETDTTAELEAQVSGKKPRKTKKENK